MSIHSFKKENLHCVWDDSLLGKTVLCADTLVGLYYALECESVPERRVTSSSEISYPFLDDDYQMWRFAYVVEEPSYNPGDDEVKLAYLQGHSVMRRFLNDEWEVMRSTSYFDLPGYEYKVASDIASSATPSRVSNKALAIWLAEGKGLLLDVKLNYVNTTYTFVADDIDCEVPDGYKVMPIDGSVWLEPTDDVIC